MKNREAIEIYLRTLHMMRDESGKAMMTEFKNGNGKEYGYLAAIHNQLEITAKIIANITPKLKN